MKHSSCLLLFVPLLLLAFVACGNGQRMRSQLAALQARNQADSQLTNDSLALALTHYFDRHGTARERMLARYLLARTYVDQGKAPQALDQFQQAARQADTTSSDCDFALLSRVHGQTAELFYSMLLPHEMLAELQMASNCAWKAADTLVALVAFERQNFAYDLLGQQDTALSVALQAYRNYQRWGRAALVGSSANTLFFYYVDRQDWPLAARYMREYEQLSGCFQNGELLPGRELHYYYKGQYFMGIARYDSAEHYFRKELRLARDMFNREAAFKGLYDLYKHLGLRDSIVKYADSCYNASAESYRENTADKLRHMHALYNYNEFKEQARQKLQEARRAHWQLIAFVVLAVMTFLLGLILFLRWKQRRRKEMQALLQDEHLRRQQLQADYEKLLAEQERAQTELERLHHEAFSLLLQEKEQEIRLRQVDIDELKKQLHDRQTADASIMSTAIYQRFRYYASHPKEVPHVSEINMLFATVEEHLPAFYPMLHAGKSITRTDYYICVLIRLRFAQVEISTLTGIATSNLTRKRRQLLLRCFGKEGSAEEFNDIVCSIK